MPPSARASVLSPAILAKIGKALYGHQWQTPLAEDLGMSDRSMRYLVDGTRPIHAELARDILTVIDQHAAELTELMGEIAEIVAGIDAPPEGDGFQSQVTAGPRPGPKR